MLSDSLSFAEINRVLNEGTAQEVAMLQAQIAQIETAIQQRTKPLVDRKQRLSQLLAQKQKVLNAEQQKAAVQQSQPQTTQPAEPQA